MLQAAGGIWLIYLGARAWLRSARSQEGLRREARRQRDFQAGLVTVLLNPLAGAFYMAALPGFVRPGEGAVGTTLVLAAIHIGMVMVWMATCAFIVARGGRTFGPRSLQLVTRATAVVLVAFGVRAVLAVLW